MKKDIDIIKDCIIKYITKNTIKYTYGKGDDSKTTKLLKGNFDVKVSIGEEPKTSSDIPAIGRKISLPITSNSSIKIFKQVTPIDFENGEVDLFTESTLDKEEFRQYLQSYCDSVNTLKYDNLKDSEKEDLLSKIIKETPDNVKKVLTDTQKDSINKGNSITNTLTDGQKKDVLTAYISSKTVTPDNIDPNTRSIKLAEYLKLKHIDINNINESDKSSIIKEMSKATSTSTYTDKNIDENFVLLVSAVVSSITDTYFEERLIKILQVVNASFMERITSSTASSGASTAGTAPKISGLTATEIESIVKNILNECR